MDWVPKAIEELRIFIGEHEFAAGFCVALVFIAVMRHVFFRSSERVLQQMNNDLKKRNDNLEKSLKQEQKRVAACHKELTDLTERQKQKKGNYYD